jgi:mono/diheme cytochrome c family protein
VKRLALIAVLVFAAGCRPAPAPAPLTLASGEVIPSSVLREGQTRFLQYCAPCHGVAGDGRGPSAAHLRPLPRDFRLGLFKFGGVAAGELPTDEALMRTLRRGLHGTPMRAWDVPESQRRAILQFLKTLSPRWKEERAGAPIDPTPDPWRGRAAQAIARGEALYHLNARGHAGCNACHPSYLSHQALSDLSQRELGHPLTRFSPAMYDASPRDSDYPLTVDAAGNPLTLQKVLPPDFLLDRTATVFDVGAKVEGRPYTAAEQRVDLYRVIAAGVGGAAMPAWRGALPEDSVWALAYYVQSLISRRGTPEAIRWEQTLEGQAAGTPPR